MNRNPISFRTGCNLAKIVICGSMSQSDQMVNIVNVLNKLYKIEFGIDLDIICPHRGQEKMKRVNLAMNHFEKIKNADVVLALSKPDGSFGESTSNEIAFALENGVLVIPIRLDWLQSTSSWNNYTLFSNGFVANDPLLRKYYD